MALRRDLGYLRRIAKRIRAAMPRVARYPIPAAPAPSWPLVEPPEELLLEEELELLEEDEPEELEELELLDEDELELLLDEELELLVVSGLSTAMPTWFTVPEEAVHPDSTKRPSLKNVIPKATRLTKSGNANRVSSVPSALRRAMPSTGVPL